MKLNSIAPAVGAVKSSKRIGRGIGSGHGKTSCKGHKGQWARSGGGVRPGFEGGQMPLTRRIPKRGFNSQFRVEYTIVNVGSLECFEAGSIIDLETLHDMGIVGKIEAAGLKVLGDGELSKAITVKAAKFSKTASEKIEKVGGKIEVI
jgi:large subunit ribosomal protein L15